MQVTMEKLTTYRAMTSNVNGSHQNIRPSEEADYSVFGAKEIRDVLKSKAHCLHAGFPANHVIIQTLNEIRKHYIIKVGLPTYLSQMLGPAGQAQMQYCMLYDENHRQLKIDLNGNHNQSVQRFIAKHFPIHKLPFKLEVRNESNTDQVDVRYL